MYRNAFTSIAVTVFFTILVSQTLFAQRRVSFSVYDNENRVFSLVNRERTRDRLPALAWNDRLADLARTYSQKMARERFFDHIDSDGNDVVERARRLRIRGWSKIGENLFLCSPTDEFVTLAVRGWMRSPSHRENILDPEWNETGIGIAYSRNGDIYITEVFSAS
jgi:uncharacterized protein YkwD